MPQKMVATRRAVGVAAAAAAGSLAAAPLFVAPSAGAGPAARAVGQSVQLNQRADIVSPGAGASRAPIMASMAGVGLAVLTAASHAGSRAQGKTIQRAFENELGVQAPVGFFDPAGLSKDGDVTSFQRRRETELKHGRVAMYATMGYITPEYFKFPGYLSPSQGLKFDTIPNGLAAISKVPAAGWCQIVIFLGCTEISNGFEAYKKGKQPGDYGWKPITSSNPETLTKKLNAELANGRLAMMAIMGMLFQDGLTGSAWGDWANYTDSPLRAFENELGVQAPFGFWDPLGYTVDGNVDNFTRRRVTEIKHGRVAMWACMGYITPEFFRWPGFCVPSENLSFDAIPNGLAALDKVPALGWTQMFLFAGLLETGFFVYDPSRAPGDYEKGGILGAPNGTTLPPGETKTKKLNAELANGRLAMMAIIGMFFQDGLTGSAWGDWATYTASPLRAFESELGVQAPVGFFDPAGLSKDGDADAFTRRRVTEIKHGRVAMWACMGYITPEFFRWPGFCSPSQNVSFNDVPNGLAAIKVVPAAGWVQMLLFAAFLEKGVFTYDASRAAGDYARGGILGVPNGSTLPAGETKTKKLNAELANGRLAMMAIVGMLFQDGLTGSAWGDWALYTASPLRAFESELGVQAPIGFWDPAGFTSDGSVDNFARRRQTELKHGRIAMLATMGYITPEVAGKFPGFLSPSAGLKYADIPNGLAAISKVPGAGWAQMIAYAALCETSQDQSPGSKGAAGDFGYKVLTSSDPSEKTNKLAAELANGRLAMMAIIGMFFQDGLTGSAWGDWALYTASPLRAFAGHQGYRGRSDVTRNFFGGDSPSYAGSFDPATQLGVQEPLGFWDPMGLSADKDEATFKRRRAVEIKHGRISMYACMGYIAPEYYKFPGFLSPSLGLEFKDVPNGLAALSKVPVLGWAQIAWFAGLIEATGFFQGVKNIGGRRDASQTGEPGNYGVGFPTFLGKVEDPEARKTKLAAELANGRLAMMAIMGMFFQDGLTGSAWGDWALYTASPLRAFESELGVQAPIGFWDPAGFTSDGSVDNFARRRQTELKHGRIAMLATMGYITPEVAGKFPGFLSPSAGLKYADIPNGLAAISKVPGAGWAQMIAYAALCETSQDQSPGSKGAAGDFGYKVLTSSDPSEKTNKLAAELANGRLAMMAIIGMFFQDGLTGSAWGDWALYTASPLRAFAGHQGYRRRSDVTRNFFGGDSPSYAGSFDPATQLGVQEPLGFWDPMGLSADKDEATFKRRRAVEIKHGRISMYACMGYIAPEYYKFPGFLSPSLGLEFKDVPNGLAALSKVPVLGWAQIAWFAGLIEATGFFQGVKNIGGRRDASQTGEPGNYGVGFPTFLGKVEDPEARKTKLAAELANGRLAMMAIMGMLFQDGLTGSAWGDWALYTASPLRAFESELGVQAPFGFWDPLGYTVDGNVDAFQRRRATELKHGRIAMLATMGYITPEITGKFPGYLSPSKDLSFADIPNGLAAVSKVPVLGWAQIIAWMAYCEVSQNQSPGTDAYKGRFGFSKMTDPDPEKNKRKLAAEIANGRLAMMAIMGMFFQDGLTGSAWGDWALYTDSPLRAEPISAAAAAAAVAAKIGAAGAAAKGAAAAATGAKAAGGLAAGKAATGAVASQTVGATGAGAAGAAGGVTSKNTTVEKTYEPFGSGPFNASKQVGALEPLGFWDPAGLSTDQATFRQYRTAEIKHGRVAMMAALGMVIQHSNRFAFVDEGAPNGIAALSNPSAQHAFAILFFVAGFYELVFWKESENKAPGDFGDPAGWALTFPGVAQYDEDNRNRELNNGRFAMFVMIGLFVAEAQTGLDGVGQWNASVARWNEMGGFENF